MGSGQGEILREFQVVTALRLFVVLRESRSVVKVLLPNVDEEIVSKNEQASRQVANEPVLWIDETPQSVATDVPSLQLVADGQACRLGESKAI